jgi:hypothetical protein
MINNLLPTIKTLTKSDKIRLLQYLVTEIARDEGINQDNNDEEQIFWLTVSQSSLQEIWEHPDEEVYFYLTT